MRLIDADELKENLKKLEAKGNNKKYVQGLQDAIDEYSPQIIDDVPTADVEPVRYGRWVEKDGLYGFTFYCSECGADAHLDIIGERILSDFCPNCGAKMDLKEGE